MKILKKKKIDVSILIVNYNNKKFLLESINSVKKQNFYNKEIIVIDDQSTDNSFKYLKKIKGIKLLKTSNKKYKFASFNQINSYETAIKIAKGEIICFLDSDDFFNQNKLDYILKFFRLNKKKNFLLDIPFIFFNNKSKFLMNIKQRSKYFIPWIQFPPQSCISVRKDYLKRIINKINIKKFPNTWLDFRLVCQFSIDEENVIPKGIGLTSYRQNPNSQIIEYKKKYSFNWWRKRYEAHQFQKYLHERNNKSPNFSLDKFVTKLINLLIDIIH